MAQGTRTQFARLGSMAFMVGFYSGLAFLSLLLFGILHILSGSNPALGYWELGGSAVFLLNIFVAQKVKMASTVFLLTVLFFLVVMLITGGTERTGLFWFFVFPVGAFFLTNKRQQGIWWMVALLLVTGLLWVLNAEGAIQLAYDSITIGQLVISLTVVSGGIFVYQWSREQLQGQNQERSQALHTEQVRADLILQHVDEGIIATDAEGRVTFINSAAERMLGWASTELLGQRFVDKIPMIGKDGEIVPPESRPLLLSLHTGKPIVTVALYRRKDGNTLPISVVSTPLIVDGESIGIIAAFRDITEEQHLARTKSEFVTLASHQLRTPISAISWLSELLLNNDAGKLTVQQREHIQDIYRSGRRMANLVNEMLIVSSLDLGTLPVQPEPLDLKVVAKGIVKEQKTLRDEPTQHIEEHYAADLPEVKCDQDVIKLLLRNLLSNAQKYTPKDGHITLTMRTDPAIKLHANSKGSVVIEVKDTGYGIPQEATEKIFTKFYRAQNIMHKDTDGTGLGLYIVKTLLDYVGGSVSFESHEGKGTTFTVILPLEGMAKHEADARSIGATTRQGVLALRSAEGD